MSETEDKDEGGYWESENWRGVSMDEIHRNLNEFELEHAPPVAPSANHTVLHHYPIKGPDTEPPRPLKTHAKWDSLHVRMPCSPKSQYPVTAPDGTSSIESRWQMIEQAFARPFTNSHELQAAILSYNSKYEGKWSFRALHDLFENELDTSETRVFFEDLLPRIVRLALRLPEIVQAPIPLLKQNSTHSLTLTQEQIACLLANAFLCTFPRRNTLKRKSEYSTFPDINFNRLFDSPGAPVLEKIKCLCHYFRRVCPTQRDNSNVPTGVVTFTRRSLHHSEMPNWEKCSTPLTATKLHITSEGTIEDQGLGLLQVDFANKFLGGGVLGCGCVQEEIRFVICPELMVSKLFTECLRPTEALLMIGCERYSNYTGYAGTFQWAGNHEDGTPRDSSRRRFTHIVAIDALAFQQSEHQYRGQLMQRELNKAYVGFLHTLDTPAPGVASGNWGCGAFRGDATLKALLQLMVCSVVGRPLAYFTFGDEELRDQVYRMYKFFVERELSVGKVWRTLCKFEAQHLAPKELYNFIYSCLGDRDEQKHSLITRVVKRIRDVATQMKAAAPATVAAAAAATAVATAAAVTTPPPQQQQQQQAITINASDDDNDVVVVMAEKTKETPKASPSKKLNISEDIFDIDSDSDPAVATKSPSSSSSVQCVDDGVAAPSGISGVCANGNSEATRKKATEAWLKEASPKVRTPTTTGRQRTLLEMLDQCYTNGPATKRHCASAPIDKKVTTTTTTETTTK